MDILEYHPPKGSLKTFSIVFGWLNHEAKINAISDRERKVLTHSRSWTLRHLPIPSPAVIPTARV